MCFDPRPGRTDVDRKPNWTKNQDRRRTEKGSVWISSDRSSVQSGYRLKVAHLYLQQRWKIWKAKTSRRVITPTKSKGFIRRHVVNKDVHKCGGNQCVTHWLREELPSQNSGDLINDYDSRGFVARRCRKYV